MKRVLVTDGAGFIGSNLIESLPNEKNEISSLDCYFSSTEKNHIDGVNYIKGYTGILLKCIK